MVKCCYPTPFELVVGLRGLNLVTALFTTLLSSAGWSCVYVCPHPLCGHTCGHTVGTCTYIRRELALGGWECGSSQVDL